LKRWQDKEKELEEILILTDIAREGEDPEDADELGRRVDALDKELDAYEIERMLGAENDKENAIVYINAGAGGTEAQDWAEMLLRMYLKWAEKKGFESEVVDLLPGDEAGVKNVTFLLKGAYAYGYMKCESGIHRLVRISPFDANARRHTSFASVYSYPELPEDIQVDIREEDLRVDTFRSSGPGGQHVNTTDSAVRITHIPTGLVVTCQDEKSQHKNKAKALRVLRARLKEQIKEEQEQEVSAERRKQVGTGDRSERIRTYNFPQGRLTDHRVGLTLYRLEDVLAGNLDPVLDPVISHFQAELLKAR